MNPKAKARKRQRDRARSKERKEAARAGASQELTHQKTRPLEHVETSSNSALGLSEKPIVSIAQPSPHTVLKKKFLTQQDGEDFEKLVNEHYQGFVHIPADDLTPSNFHRTAKAAFEKLRDANYYQYDVVMAGGKHSSRTFVKRTLVGEPGITYKYLGLRLFAHAWSGPGCLPIMKTIGGLNNHMIQMTKQHKSHNMCNYNLTLINYMEPTSHTKVGFKDEAYYNMGKVSVSWHADSSLEKNSSIGVYHCLPTQRAAKWDWRIALRRSPDLGPTDVLPVAVSTKDGDVYFLLGTMNETHQHCVLAGSEANRISSTHRVAVTEEDTYQYILKRVKRASKGLRTHLEGQPPSQLNAAVVVHCQQILTEVEMEWISQYWLQGEEHDKMHIWWQHPIKTLEVFWMSLEELTFRLYRTCIEEPINVPREVIEGLIAELKNRQKQRKQWDERRADKIYQRRISAPYRPVARPLFAEDNKLEKDLTAAIGKLCQILMKKGATLTQHEKGKKKKKKKKKKVNGETYVESKTGGGEDGPQPQTQSKEPQQLLGQTKIKFEGRSSDTRISQQKRPMENSQFGRRKKMKK